MTTPLIIAIMYQMSTFAVDIGQGISAAKNKKNQRNAFSGSSSFGIYFVMVLLDWMMILSGFVGVLFNGTSAAYVLWTFGMLCYVALLYFIIKLSQGTEILSDYEAESGKNFQLHETLREALSCSRWLIILTWTCYPIIWIFS